MVTTWFKAKRVGFGWYPASQEGWIVTLVYILLLVGGVYFLLDRLQTTTTVSQLSFAVAGNLFLLTGIFTWICYKTGEPPRWRWGK